MCDGAQQKSSSSAGENEVFGVVAACEAVLERPVAACSHVIRLPCKLDAEPQFRVRV
jgi:hypothetical protein